jgi:hypothetical protein
MTYDRPCELHADLTDERLEAIAAIFCRVRAEVRDHMQRHKGDDNSVFGYTSYRRSCFEIEDARTTYDWLGVIRSGKGEHFVFRIGVVPIRFYSGEPETPSHRWFAREDAESAAHQEAFDLPGANALNWMLRFTVYTNLVSGMTWVSLARFDIAGEILNVWSIRTPELVANDAVVSLAEQRAGVDLEAPVVEDPAETETGLANAPVANETVFSIAEQRTGADIAAPVVEDTQSVEKPVGIAPDLANAHGDT